MAENSIAPALSELERMFHEFTPLFPAQFQGKQTIMSVKPVFVIQSRGRRENMLGSFQALSWQNGHEKLHEISLSSETLARDVEAIAGTVIHEMAHLFAHVNGFKDVGSNGTYHNATFKAIAETAGLTVRKQGTRGYADTQVSDDLRKKISAVAVDHTAFALFRLEQERKAKKPAKLHLWICSTETDDNGKEVACTKIRAAGDIDVQCRVCGNLFSKQEKATGTQGKRNRGTEELPIAAQYQ